MVGIHGKLISQNADGKWILTFAILMSFFYLLEELKFMLVL